MILTFADAETAKVASGKRSRYLPPDIQATAFRKLEILKSAATLPALAALPGNRLEALKGDRKRQHSIRVKQQWRVCFRWTPQGAEDVEIVDYH